MNKLNTALLSAMLIGLTGTAQASPIPLNSIVADGNGSINNGDCTFACVVRYQQAYGASLFSGLTEIRGIDFTASNGGTWSENEYAVTLSTAVNGVNQLVANFDANTGSDAALFETKSFSGSVAAGGLVGFSGSFNYDPTQGDLLVDIHRITGSQQSMSLNYVYGENTLNEFSRLYSFDDLGTGYVGNNYGNVTTFTTGEGFAGQVSAVPVPAAAWLFGSGLLGLVGIARRKTRA